MTSSMNHSRRRGDVKVRTMSWERHQQIELAILSSGFLALAVPVLYIVKSALGIDLLDGPSPLHDYLFWIVR
jgi:hypothetical protein